MDPNWFYSSLSQSAAAIIGLIGAILVSRLLQQLASVRESKSQIIRDFLSLRGTLTSVITNVREYIAYLDKEIPENQRVLQTGGNKRHVTAAMNFSGGWSGGGGQYVDVTAELVANQERDRGACDDILSICRPIVAVQTVDDIGDHASRFAQLEERVPEEARRHRLSGIGRGLSGLANRCAQHQSSVTPRSAVVMVVVLAWLSGSGVVAPLAFLYAGPRSGPKWVLLTAFAVGMVGLLVYLALLIRDIRDAGRLDIPERERLAQMV